MSEGVIIPMSVKDDRIIQQANETDEPIFVLRAKDLLSVLALQAYIDFLEKYEANDAPILVEAVDRLNEFREWQKANPGKVKLPD